MTRVTGVVSVSLCAALAWTVPAFADDAAAETAAESAEPASKPRKEAIEEITVTGSLVPRVRTDGPQAVTVIGRAEIESLGVQSPVDLIDRLPANAGSEFRSDAFKAGGQYGTANINLRGLGLGTTLVLVDGRRQPLSGVVSNDGASFVDINDIPLQMIERVEVLKEGAAATYGSDAVAGVVNFITRKNIEGFEVNTQFQTTTEDGQREQGVAGIWGWGNDRTRLQVFANYFNANELESEDRSFTQALRGADGRFLPNNRSPFGFSSLGAPGAQQPFIFDPMTGLAVPQGGLIPDKDCEAVGGVMAAGGTRCGFEFADNFNLAENEQRAKYAFTFSHDFSEALSVSFKWNYAFNKIDDVGQSPSFPPSTQFRIPGDSPFNTDPMDRDTLYVGRPLAERFPTQRAFYDNRTNRYELGLNGDLGDTWSWDLNASYARSRRDVEQVDTFRSEFALALAGFGGPDCQFLPEINLLGNVNSADVGGRQVDQSQAGVGNCKYFNPNGTAFLNPAQANDLSVIQNFTGSLEDSTTTSLQVIDWVLTGNLLELKTGPVGVAFGAQFRRETYDVSRNADGTARQGPARFIFLGGGDEFNSDRHVTSLFSELNIPVRDDLELQAALRFEDYNRGGVGSSVDPKLAFRYQPVEWLGVRGSFSTTFRAPTLSQQRSQRTENEVIRDVFNTGFLPIDSRGSEDLKPEEADVYNFGVQFKPSDRLSFGVDYFRIDFNDLVVVENAQQLVATENALNGGTAMGSLAGMCSDPNFQRGKGVTRDENFKDLMGRCAISRVTTDFVNQDSVLTDGIDVSMVYDFEVTGLDTLRLRSDLTHLIQYDIDTDAGTIKAAGQRNEGNFARALPKWRVNAGFDSQLGAHSAGFTVRYTSSYEDDDRVRGNGFTDRIDDHTTVDLYYAYEFSQFNATMQVGVIDVFNREPPFVNTDFNFDSRTADARGRRVYANLTWRYN